MTVRKAQKVLFAFAFAIIVNGAYSQQKSDSASVTKAGLDEIHGGLSYRELPHVGIFFGNKKASFGVYGGGWEGYWSVGMSLKVYTKKQKGLTPTRFFRLATGWMVEAGEAGIDQYGVHYDIPASLELFYMAFTFGKDLYLGEHMGISLEGGLMFVPPLEGSLAEDLYFPMFPAVGVKLFYKRKGRVK